MPESFFFRIEGNCDIIDITPAVQKIVEEEIKEEIQPVEEPVLETEGEDLKDEEAYFEDAQPLHDVEEEEVIKHTKLRIRIDKDNEIEPVEEEDLSSEPAETINATEEEIESEDEQEETENQNIEYEQEQVDDKIELTQQEIKEEKLNGNNDDESSADPMHPDVVYEQIVKEEQEHEESMLKTIIQNSEVKPEDKEDDSQEDLFKENGKQKMDIAELLEHKDMTRIIEVIFDYDIEEFANTLDEISGCVSLEDALVVLNQSLKNRNISRNSKEAEAFKSIISQYFNKK